MNYKEGKVLSSAGQKKVSARDGRLRIFVYCSPTIYES